MAELGSVADGCEKSDQEEGEGGPGRSIAVEAAEGPDQKGVEFFVPLHFPRGQEDELPDDACCYIAEGVLTKGEETVQQFSLCDKGQTLIFGEGVTDKKRGEDLQLVDKTFFASFCTLGNTGQAPMVTAEKGDDKIRFTMLPAVENNGCRFLLLVPASV